MPSSMKLFVLWLLCNLICAAKVVKCSWGSPGEGQYHIQTDEGPERYFRFQTDNGQFRKEKRLQDGTVIGTEAWIDAAGFLRLKDYIADTQGYRILKSKTVFVGQGRQIEDAIKSTKSVPAQSGVLVDGAHGSRHNSIGHSTERKHSEGFIYSTTPIPTSTTPFSTTTTTTVAPPRGSGYLSPAEAARLEPTPHLGYDHYPDELPQRYPSHPVVHIRPHSEPIDNGDFVGEQQNSLSENDYYTSSVRPILAPVPSQPSLSIQPPLPPSHRRRIIRPISVVATTPTPISAHEAAAAPPLYSSSTPSTVYDGGYSTPSPFVGNPEIIATTAAPGYFYAPQPTAPVTPNNVALPYDINNLEVLQPPLLPKHYRNKGRQPQLPIQVHSNSIGAGYEGPPPLDGEYDGIAATRNGFRYYLPRQYHEEENFDDQKRAGSFGYVDPFGIRRVIYYNASPENGFVHRKNNRYVGFNAAPYDPRPSPY